MQNFIFSKRAQLTSCQIFFMVLQATLFVVSRVIVELMWFYTDQDDADIFSIVSLGLLIISTVIVIILKCRHKNILSVFLKTQPTFLIAWSMILVTIYVFYHTFECESDGKTNKKIQMSNCILYMANLILMTLHISFISNTNFIFLETIVYLILLIVQIIFNNILVLVLLESLSDYEKDTSILYVVFITAALSSMMGAIISETFEKYEEEKFFLETEIKIRSIIRGNKRAIEGERIQN